METPTGHPIVYWFGLQVVCCDTWAESRCLMVTDALLYMEIGSVVIIVIVMLTQLTSHRGVARIWRSRRHGVLCARAKRAAKFSS